MPERTDTIIQASELGQWSYCHRSWWLAQHGYRNENRGAMRAGIETHERHARDLASAIRIKQLAMGLLLLGALLMAIALLTILW